MTFKRMPSCKVLPFMNPWIYNNNNKWVGLDLNVLSSRLPRFPYKSLELIFGGHGWRQR